MPPRKPVLRSALEGHQTLVVHHRQGPGRGTPHPADMRVVHDHASLSLVLGGELQLWQGASYRVGPGELLLVPPGAPHGPPSSAALHPGPEDVWMMAICPSCLALHPNALESSPFDEVAAGACPVRRVAPDRLDRLVDLFTTLDEELRTRRPHHELATRGLLTQLMAEVQRAAPGAALPGPDSTPPLVTETLTYIERHACEPISLKEVARAMGKSPAYLTTLVREHTGATVMEWLTRARLSRARQLLLHSDEHVAIIAERVGYSSASYFHRVFRQAHQVSPGEWRRVHGGGG